MRLNWHVFRKTLTLANTQYSQVITADPVFVSVKNTNGLNDFRLSLIDAQTEGAGTQYVTVLAGTSWESPVQMFGTKTIYLSSDTAGIEIEIEVWN